MSLDISLHSSLHWNCERERHYTYMYVLTVRYYMYRAFAQVYVLYIDLVQV